jgi:hypothetical protein
MLLKTNLYKDKIKELFVNERNVEKESPVSSISADNDLNKNIENQKMDKIKELIV